MRKMIMVVTMLLVLVGCRAKNDYQLTDYTMPKYTSTEMTSQLTEVETPTPLPNEKSTQGLFAYTFISWQEAYTSVLRHYASLTAKEPFDEWLYVLHDVDANGTPELFVMLLNDSGHLLIPAIYTFVDERLQFIESYIGMGSIFAPFDDSPWIFVHNPVGSGGSFQQAFMDNSKLVLGFQGTYALNDEGFKISETPEGFYKTLQSYQWHRLSINGEVVTMEEFEALFGGRKANRHLNPTPIIQANIDDLDWIP